MTRRSAKALTLLSMLLAPGCGSNDGARDALEASVLDAAADATEGDADADAATCPVFGEPLEVGALADSSLDELSGLVASRTHENVYWTHEDSGAGAVVYALSTAGEVVSTATLDGASAYDWEDIGLGRVPDEEGDFLFIADIGDNNRVRSSVVVYRAREPETLSASTSLHAHATTLTYPDRAHDAEAFFVDPRNGDAYLVTKDLVGVDVRLFRWPASPLSTTSATLEDLGPVPVSRSLPLGRTITGADMCPDGRTILLRAYKAVWLYDVGATEAVADALARTPCGTRGPIEDQGEAIACDADPRSFTTVSEGVGAKLWRVGW